MSTTAIAAPEAIADARVEQVDLKLEVTTIPVADLDRKFTPPGSPASIHFTLMGVEKGKPLLTLVR